MCLFWRSATFLRCSFCSLQLKDNIEKFFTWFVEEGKATVRIKEPAIDICLSKVRGVVQYKDSSSAPIHIQGLFRWQTQLLVQKTMAPLCILLTGEWRLSKTNAHMLMLLVLVSNKNKVWTVIEGETNVLATMLHMWILYAVSVTLSNSDGPLLTEWYSLAPLWWTARYWLPFVTHRCSAIGDLSPVYIIHTVLCYWWPVT